MPTLLWFHAYGRNMLGPTMSMLRVVGKQCCVRLHGPLCSLRFQYITFLCLFTLYHFLSLHYTFLCFCLRFSFHFAFLYFALFFILAFACLSSCLTRFCLAWLAYALPCPSFVCFTQFTFLHSFCFYFSFNCFALPCFTLYLSLLCSGFL